MPVECKELACQVCSDSGFIDPTAGCITAQYSDEQPSLSSETVSWFSSSADFPSGLYRVLYLTGAIKYNGSENWALNRSPSAGFYIKLNDGTSSINGPGQDYLQFTSESDLEDHNAGQFVDFYHSGGKIGIHLFDFDYTDNSGGEQGPLFRLFKICVVQQPPTPPEPPLDFQYTLDSTGFSGFFEYPPPFILRSYQPPDLTPVGFAIWLVTSISQRQLIHIFEAGDFTEGDILDFTSYMNLPPVTDLPGVERTICITVLGSNDDGTWEIPMRMSQNVGGEDITNPNIFGIVQGDAPNDYDFVYEHHGGTMIDTPKNDVTGALIPDYTAEDVQFAVSQRLPPLQDD